MFEAFAAGLRGRYGKLPVSGEPRITRPRPRKNAGGLSGFSLIDPAGNWVRFQSASHELDSEGAAKLSPLRASLLNAGAMEFLDELNQRSPETAEDQ